MSTSNGLAAEIREVQIEVTSFCNADCPFCINRATFATEGRKSKGLSKEALFAILERIRAAGIGRVRFTGGEPLLRKDLFDIAEFAKNLGLIVGLNTNGFLVDKYVAQIMELIDFVLISILSTSSDHTDRVMATRASFAKKSSALELLRKHTNLWTSTVLCEHSIMELEALYLFMKRYDVTHWILLRPEDNTRSSSEYQFSNKELKQFLMKAAKIKEKYGETLALGNAFPICSDPSGLLGEMMERGQGSTASEGRSKLVIDPEGRILPHYGIDLLLGKSSDDLAAAWAHPFAVKLRSMKACPAQCQDCKAYQACRGGSRLAARAMHGDLFTADPLMPIYNLPSPYAEILNGQIPIQMSIESK